jgi:hypothetical protein
MPEIIKKFTLKISHTPEIIKKFTLKISDTPEIIKIFTLKISQAHLKLYRNLHLKYHRHA